MYLIGKGMVKVIIDTCAVMYKSCMCRGGNGMVKVITDTSAVTFV